MYQVRLAAFRMFDTPAVFHGVLVYFQGDFWLFGGTSVASPQWAAIAAIADQKAGKRLGFVNGALYRFSSLQHIRRFFMM